MDTLPSPVVRTRAVTLRTSCDTCASARVGCTKEKPKCTRCEKRSLPCSYSVTRRAGRKSQTRQYQSRQEQEHEYQQCYHQRQQHYHQQQQLHHYQQQREVVGSDEAAILTAAKESSAHNTMGLFSPATGMITPGTLTPLDPPRDSNFDSPARPQPTPRMSQSPGDLMPATFSDIFASAVSPNNASSTLMPLPLPSDIDDLFASMASFPTFDPTVNSLFPAPEPTTDTAMVSPSTAVSGTSIFPEDHNAQNARSLLFGDGSISSHNPTRTGSVSGLHSPGSAGSNLFPIAAGPPNPAFGSPPRHAHSTTSHRASSSTAERSSTISSSEQLSMGGRTQPQAACRCVEQAIAFLTDLSTNSSANPRAENAAQDGAKGSPLQPRNLDNVIAQNQTVLAALKNMLICSCAQDVYLLVIISFVVCKILEQYAVAAAHAQRLQGSSDQGRRLSSSRMSQHSIPSSLYSEEHDFDDEDGELLAAQHVLSKLHGVQAVVSLLSQQLRKVAAHTSNDRQRRMQAGSDDESPRNLDKLTLPFSADCVKLLEADLRKRLRELARAVVEKLRRR